MPGCGGLMLEGGVNIGGMLCCWGEAILTGDGGTLVCDMLCAGAPGGPAGILDSCPGGPGGGKRYC